MRARLVQIGNSRGVLLPEPLIEQAGLGDEVILEVQVGGILIASSNALPRAGWAEGQRKCTGREVWHEHENNRG